jgi:hypothetical protein
LFPLNGKHWINFHLFWYFRLMHPLPKIFFTGMLISFLGSLPLGTLNVAAMQIGITDGYTAAILFSLGSLLVEMIYVRFPGWDGLDQEAGKNF